MKLPPDVDKLIRATAPTLAAALSGPFAGIASAVVTFALEKFLPKPEGYDGFEIDPAHPELRRPPASPADVAGAIADNRNDPDLGLALKEAEARLKRYELKMGNDFSFAKLEAEDRKDARAFSKDSGLSRPMFFIGMGFVGLTILILFTIMILAGLTLTGAVELNPDRAGIAPVVFNTIGSVVTSLVAVMMLILGFYYGSSAGSKTKETQFGAVLENLGVALADQAERPAVPPPPAPVIVQAAAPAVLSPAPAAAEGPWHQGPHGGRRWRLTPGGVVPEGEASPMRTVGQPATVRRIWRDFGPLIAASCARNGVPLELAVACIAVESRGRAADVREEPGYVSDHETPHKVSVGLMQTLLSTASETMGRTVTRQDLLDPATSIEAGVRYMAKQRPKTQYQPPLAAAAYNAGGLYPPREGDDNPWRLRSTGDHVSRFCQFMGDACFVAAEEGWGHTAERAA